MGHFHLAGRVDHRCPHYVETRFPELVYGFARYLHPVFCVVAKPDLRP
jgi:hypothetical protein